MAKTPLNKTIRFDIIDNVMKATDFDEQKEALLKEASVLARQLLLAKLPAGFLASTIDLPPEWFNHKSQVYLGSSCPKVHLGYTGCYHQLDIEPVRLPAHVNPEPPREAFAEINERADKIYEAQEKVRSELAAFLQSCRYVEDVIERAPELQKHIPAKSKPMLPVANTNNLFSLLTKAGFDRTEKACTPMPQ